MDKEVVLTVKEVFQGGTEERNHRILAVLLEILTVGQKEAKV